MARSSPTTEPALINCASNVDGVGLGLLIKVGSDEEEVCRGLRAVLHPHRHAKGRVSALLDDLETRGLLDETLIAMVGSSAALRNRTATSARRARHPTVVTADRRLFRPLRRGGGSRG